MKVLLISLAVLSWCVSLLVAYRLIRSELGWLEKLGGCLLLAVPIFGVFLYVVVVDPPPVKQKHLQARGGRGSFTHDWITFEPILREGLERVAELDEDAKAESEDGDRNHHDLPSSRR